MEIARRTLSPLTFRRVQEALSATGRALRDEPVDLSKERFSVYVPAGEPPRDGYGLLVFVAPWSQATRPRRWRPALDRRGLIFVSAENSGNEAKVLDRRVPLALLAFENVRARYPIDPKRVYIGGFSGGSRVAQVTALAYPELFRGVLLNAGSDPIDGEKGTYIPPADLFRLFQRTRLVYVTGQHDDLNLHDDAVSQASMKDRCVLGIASLVARRLGHEALDPAALDDALEALDRPSQVDDGALEECNARLLRRVASRLADAEARHRARRSQERPGPPQGGRRLLWRPGGAGHPRAGRQAGGVRGRGPLERPLGEAPGGLGEGRRYAERPRSPPVSQGEAGGAALPHRDRRA
jgi:pimeloyl-ACP methyl ester carboxylesterase